MGATDDHLAVAETGLSTPRPTTYISMQVWPLMDCIKNLRTITVEKSQQDPLCGEVTVCLITLALFSQTLRLRPNAETGPI